MSNKEITQPVIDIIENQFWEYKGFSQRIKIMAIKDKYAMARVKGCLPFVISYHELRLKYNPIPVQKK